MENINYYRICLRYKWVMIASFIVLVSIVGTCINLMEPVYEAECKLLLLDNKEKNSLSNFTVEDMMMQTIGKEDEPVLTKIEMLKTRPLMEETIKRCSIQTKEKTLINHDELLKRFMFENVKMTNIIQIIYRDKNRDDAPHIVNMLARIFIEENQRINKEKIKNTKDFIEKQLILQKRRVEEAELAVMKSKVKSRTISLAEKMSVQVNTIAALEAERIRLEAEVRGFKAQASEINGRLNQNGSQTAPYYSSLIETKEQGSIALTNLIARIHSIDNELVKQYRSLKSLPALEIELARLTREEKIMNDLYINLLAKYEECKIQEAAQVSSIKIIEPATVTEYPVFPNKKKSIMLAGVAGLLFGVGLSFFVEYLRDRPQSTDEIKKILNLEQLGSIPKFSKRTPIFMKDDPLSSAADSIRLIYANLKFKNMFNKDTIAIMITSAQPYEGKSTVAVNMAIKFANSGKRTALVNLDLNHCSFDKLTKHKFKKGFIDYLRGEADLDQVTYKTEFNDFLTIIPSGENLHNSFEMICTPKMTEYVNHLRLTFDVVVFDTAPITLAAEPLHIARNTDGIILVVDYLKTSRRVLKEMYNIFHGKDLPLLGLINNRDNSTMHYYKEYGLLKNKNHRVAELKIS